MVGRLAIAAGGEPCRPAVRSRGVQFGDRAVGGDATELVLFRVPDVAVRANCNIDRRAFGGDWELRDFSGSGDAGDLVGIEFDKPEIAVGSGRDVSGTARGAWEIELGNLA